MLDNLIQNIQKFGLENIFSKYYGRYLAKVSDTEDPKGLHQIRVIVFAIDDVEPLPVWATYHSPWAGKNFGANFPVRKDDLVWVSFEYGDLDFPIWHSGNYAEGDLPEQIKTNKQMGFVSRDGHYDVLDEEAKSWMRKMKEGSFFELAEKDINLKSVKDFNINVDENMNVNVTKDLMAQITENVNLQVNKALTAMITDKASFSAKSIHLAVIEQLHLGADVGVYSVVWGEILDAFLRSFLVIFNAHNHVSPFLGIPTSPSLIQVGALPPFLSQKVKTI